MTDEQPKIPFTEILRSLPAERFQAVFAASSRKARETYFHRHGVKASSGGSRLPKPGAKNEERTARLMGILQQKVDDEMSEEILRTWLLTKRPMLSATLDHLGIKHDNGLTDSDDIKKFEKLSGGDIKALVKKLEGVATKDEIIVYLRFMGASAVEKALS